jgi:hypothetical protein
LIIGFIDHLGLSQISYSAVVLSLLSLLCLHQSLPGDGSQQCPLFPWSRSYLLATVSQLTHCSNCPFWLQIQRSRVRFPALPDFLRAIVRLEGLGKLKKIHLIGTRSHNLPACSIVPQQTTLPRAPIVQLENKIIGRESQGAFRQDVLICGKLTLILTLTLRFTIEEPDSRVCVFSSVGAHAARLRKVITVPSPES